MLYHYFETCGAVGGQNVNNRLALHDPATLLYLLEPDCFYKQKVFCNVCDRGIESYGYTVIDLYDIEKKSEKEKNMTLVKVKMDKLDYLNKQVVELLNNYE